MICITSISPNNIQRQQMALNTWMAFKHKIISFNCKSEIEVLKSMFSNVEFIEVKKTGQKLYGKPYVFINDLVDYAKEHECLLINSDILINNIIPKPNPNECIVLNRRDIKDYNYHNATLLQSGYDAFYLTPNTAKLLPKTDLALGQCHWDYWLPYMMAKNRVKLITYRRPLIYHEVHPVQYSHESWVKTAEIFRKETGLEGSLEEVSTQALKFIRSRTITKP